MDPATNVKQEISSLMETQTETLTTPKPTQRKQRDSQLKTDEELKRGIMTENLAKKWQRSQQTVEEENKVEKSFEDLTREEFATEDLEPAENNPWETGEGFNLANYLSNTPPEVPKLVEQKNITGKLKPKQHET